MDSVTQITLGSAVAYAAVGNQIGRKALLVGAALGTLPDLDVLIDFGGAVENFVFHRSFSHSLLVHLLLAPLLAMLFSKFAWAKPASFRRWTVGILLILSTHALLDSFTIYGTQLLWPLTDYPFGFSNLFIVDPSYTLPLLLSLLVLGFIKNGHVRQNLNTFALVISSVYVVWSLGAKWYIDDKIEQSFALAGIEPIAFESTPAPFNTFLWRGVATTQAGHYEVYASVFDSPSEVSHYFYPTVKDKLMLLPSDSRIDQLKEFTKGLYAVYQKNNTLLMSDIRMGVEGAYVFTFEIGEVESNGYQLGSFNQLDLRPPVGEASSIFKRILDPKVNLSNLAN